jgi:hypothetical protein
MSKGQFYDRKSQISPFKFGLFNKDELKEFVKYFKNKSTDSLTTDYNSLERDNLKIGKLEFDEIGNVFKMCLNDLFDNEKGGLFTNFIDLGSDFPQLIEMDNQIRRTSIPPAKSDSKKNRKSKMDSNVNNNIESIKVFKIQSTTSEENFEHGYHPCVCFSF